MAREVRIENRTRSSVLAKRCRVASAALERVVGLLASPEPAVGEGLLIERSPSIHMWFMRYPIDVVFVDRSHRVTKTVSRLRPWRVVAWAAGARDCIELGAGSIEASGTRVGDQLELSSLA